MADSAYVPSHLLVTRPDRFASIVHALRAAAAELGWDVVAETLGGEPADPAEVERATRALEGVHPVRPQVVRIVATDPVSSPVDAARLLRLAKRRDAALTGVELDRIMKPDG